MADRKSETLTAKLTIRLPKALLNRLQRQADGERRKLADFVRLKLEESRPPSYRGDGFDD